MCYVDQEIKQATKGTQEVLGLVEAHAHVVDEVWGLPQFVSQIIGCL